ncbi:MAG: restriction endonuclease [Actinomycetota bacterium]|nr:restriction endonuclease [Actinomycetota bacterium]
MQRVERELRRQEEKLRKEKELREEQQKAVPVGPRAGVKVRPPETADDFESVCAEWLKKCGVPGARRTPKGSDQGVDVLGGDYAGQCKFYPHQKTTAPEIRESEGARRQAGAKKMLFFHYGPVFTDEAKVAAKKLNVELWRYIPAKQTFHRES